jgi:hypothetical protein
VLIAVALSWNEVAKRALATLSPAERQRSAVYLDERELPAGSSVDIDSQQILVTAPSALVFVDLEPAANWGHASRYLIVDLGTGAVRSIDAQFPPFLRGAPKTLRLVWKGPDVPDWAVAVR